MTKNEYSLYRLMNIYMNDPHAGVRFFYDIKWPQGYHCEECGSSHYIYDEKIDALYVHIVVIRKIFLHILYFLNV